MTRRAILYSLLTLACGALWAALFLAGSEPKNSPNPTLPIASYTIGSGQSSVVLELEVAQTGNQQARGLAERDHIGKADGMAFPRDGRTRAAYWMRGMRFPLDIIYVGPNWAISEIHTAPTIDTATYPSSGPVALVIELPAGRARTLGLEVGDLVIKGKR